MSNFRVGQQLLVTVTVTDKATGNLVDPATFLFTMLPPVLSAILTGTYLWNGTTWTNSESTIAVPTKGTLGIFTLRITLPYVNTAKGGWSVGWKSTANGGGFGEGSADLQFEATATTALP